MRLFHVESYRKSIFSSSAFAIVSMIVSFFTNMVIAYFFGTQEKTDVYFFGMSTLALISGLIVHLDSTVLVPEAMRLRTQESNEQSMRFLNFFLFSFFLLGAAITAFLFLNTSFYYTTFSSFNHSVIQKNLLLLTLLSPLLLLLIVNTLMVDILASYKFFTVPMIASVVNNCLILAFIYGFQPRLDVLSIVVGSLVGYSCNFIILIYLMKRMLGWRFNFRFRFPTGSFWKNIAFAQAGTITLALSTYIPLYLLTGLGTGIISALSYSQRTISIPNLILTGQVSRVFGVKCNQLVPHKDFKELNVTFISTAKFLLFILIPTTSFFFLFSNEIITTLFAHGKFDTLSVETTSLFLSFIGLSLAPIALNGLVSRLFMSAQNIKHLFWYQITNNLLLIIFNYIGVVFFGVSGYLWSLLAYYTFSFLLIYVAMKYFFPVIRYVDVIKYAIILLLINIPILFFLHFLHSFLTHWDPIIRLGFCALCYITLYALVNDIFHVNPQLRSIIRHRSLKFFELS